MLGDFYLSPHSPAIGYYRPLTRVFFSVQYALFGADPLGYHAVGLACFAGLAILLWFLLRALGASNFSATRVAIFVAVHPAQAETVAVIASQSDLLMALGVGGALLAYVIGRRRDRKRLLVFAAFLEVAALGFKEAALVLLPFTAAFELLEGQRGGRHRALRIWSLMVVLPAIAFLVLRFCLGIALPKPMGLAPTRIVSLWGKFVVGSVMRSLAPSQWNPALHSSWPAAQSSIALAWALPGAACLAAAFAQTGRWDKALDEAWIAFFGASRDGKHIYARG